MYIDLTYGIPYSMLSFYYTKNNYATARTTYRKTRKKPENIQAFFLVEYSLQVLPFLLILPVKKMQIAEVIQAKSFQVVDNNMTTLATLGSDKGNGSLATYTPAGKKLVYLFTSEGGAGGINTFDNDGDVLFKVTRTQGGGAYLGLFNEDAKEIVEFGNTTNKSGYMNINDKFGDKLAWITYTADGGGYFALLNNNLETISSVHRKQVAGLAFPIKGIKSIYGYPRKILMEI